MKTFGRHCTFAHGSEKPPFPSWCAKRCGRSTVARPRIAKKPWTRSWDFGRTVKTCLIPRSTCDGCARENAWGESLLEVRPDRFGHLDRSYAGPGFGHTQTMG